MPPPRAVKTLLLTPDPRRTPLGEKAALGLGHIVHSPHGHFTAPQPVASRMGFNGQLREPQGWYQLGNGYRVYNPVLMVFHSSDELSPFGRGGINAYAYCQGDPVNFTDPSGRFVMEIPSLLLGNLFDQPIASLVHNSALLVGALMLNVVAMPAGPALVASAATLLGSGVGIAGSILQFAGQKELGGRVATVGTAISAIASTVRVHLAAEQFKQMGPMTIKEFWKKTKNTFFGFKKPAAPVSKPANVGGLNKMFEAAQQPRRASAPGLLPTQTAESFKAVDGMDALQPLVNGKRGLRKVSIFGAEMGAPGPFRNMNKKRLSVSELRD